MKAATTTLAVEMASAGVTVPVNPFFNGPVAGKEFDFFDTYLNQSNWTLNFTDMKAVWYQMMPACPQPSSNARSIMADFSPQAMDDTYLGNDLRPSRLEYAGQILGKINLPSTLQYFYGAAKARQLTFMTLLREPLSKMHSAWWYSKHMQNSGRQDYVATDGIVPDSFSGSGGASFEEDLQLALNEYSQGRVTMLLWSSLFGRQLRDWMTEFEPRQFIVVPYHYYTSIATAEVCGIISQRLSFPLTCNPSAVPRNYSNDQPHPPLDESVSPDQMSRARLMFAAENRLLAEVLIDGYQNGTSLPGLNDTPSGVSDILLWLEHGW